MYSLFRKFFDILEEVIENKKTTEVYWFSGHLRFPLQQQCRKKIERSY